MTSSPPVLFVWESPPRDATAYEAERTAGKVLKVVRCLIDAHGAWLHENKISGNCILYSDYFARDVGL